MEKNVPVRTTLTATRGQKEKIVLTLAAMLDKVTLSRSAAQYFAECGKHHFAPLIAQIANDHARLEEAIQNAIEKDWFLKLCLEEDGLISEPHALSFKHIHYHPKNSSDRFFYTTHFSISEPETDPNYMTISVRATVEEVCSMVNISSKLVRLVYTSYRAEDIFKGLASEEDVKKERRQIITNLFPFPKIIWELPGTPWDEPMKQNISLNRDELRHRCLIGKKAIQESVREILATQHEAELAEDQGQ